MFETFQKHFPVESRLVVDSGSESFETKIPGLNELLTSFGGASFKHGLYRIIRAQDVSQWNARSPWVSRVRRADHLLWLRLAGDRILPSTLRARARGARHRDVRARHRGGSAGSRQCKDVPRDRCQRGRRCGVGCQPLRKLARFRGAEPAYDQCIGYKKPLFLGGEDDISNQELSDLEGHVVQRCGLPVRKG